METIFWTRKFQNFMETLKKDTPKHSFILLFSFKTTARKKKNKEKMRNNTSQKREKPKSLLVHVLLMIFSMLCSMTELGKKACYFRVSFLKVERHVLRLMEVDRDLSKLIQYGGVKLLILNHYRSCNRVLVV